MIEKYTCLCCGYKTLNDEPPGTYDICPICFWEEDDVQEDDVDYAGGANVPSLRQAQQNFLEFGAVQLNMKQNVRKPTAEDAHDPNWKPAITRTELLKDQ